MCNFQLLGSGCIVLSEQARLCSLAGLTDAEAAASAAESQLQQSSNPMPDKAQQQPASQALPSQPPHQTISLSQPAVSLVKSPLHSTDAEAQLQQLVPQPAEPLAAAQSKSQPEAQQEGQHVMNADSSQQGVQNLSCEAHETLILGQPGLADPKRASDKLLHVDAPGSVSPSADKQHHHQQQRQQQEQQSKSEPDTLAECEPGVEQHSQGDALQEQVQAKMAVATAVQEGQPAQAQMSAAEGTHGSTADSDADVNEDDNAEGRMMQEEGEASPAPAEARRSAQPSRRRQAAQRRSSPTPLASRAAGGASSGRKAAGKGGGGRGRAATPAARAAAVQKPRRSTSRSTAGKRRRSPS